MVGNSGRAGWAVLLSRSLLTGPFAWPNSAVAGLGWKVAEVSPLWLVVQMAGLSIGPLDLLIARWSLPLAAGFQGGVLGAVKAEAPEVWPPALPRPLCCLLLGSDSRAREVDVTS